MHRQRKPTVVLTQFRGLHAMSAVAGSRVPAGKVSTEASDPPAAAASQRLVASASSASAAPAPSGSK
jgi:hypothetical protein